MTKPENNLVFAWRVIIILMISTISILLLHSPLKNLINNSFFFKTIYFHIPILLTLLYAILKKRSLIRFFSIKIEAEHWDRYFWFLAILIGYFFLLLLLEFNIKISSILLYIQRTRISSNNFSYLFYFKEIIFYSVTEEIIFRGIILSGFLTLYSPIKSIVLSSLIFSFFHFNVLQFATAFPVGLLIGWYFYKTSNLLSCIIIHSLNNFIRVIALEYFINKFSQHNLTSNSTLFQNDNLLIFILISFTLLIVGLFYLYNSFKENPKSCSLRVKL